MINRADADRCLTEDTGYVWVRRRLAALPITLDGRSARISGFLCPHALVWQQPIDGDLATSKTVEFSWPAVQRICRAGGHFRS